MSVSLSGLSAPVSRPVINSVSEVINSSGSSIIERVKFFFKEYISETIKTIHRMMVKFLDGVSLASGALLVIWGLQAVVRKILQNVRPV